MNNGRFGNGSNGTAQASAPSFQLGERLIYLMIAVIMGVGVATANAAPSFLEGYYLVEDGILEWFTVGLLLFLAALCVQRAMRLRNVRQRLFLFSLVFIAFGFIFVAGEELSWGQRIFSIQTPPWLEERNQQGELNIHNFVTDDFSVNKVIFGQALTVVLVFYMFALPWAAGRLPQVNRLVELLGLPLPKIGQALGFFPAVFLPDLLLDSDQADEMMEVCGILMLVAIFLYPKNSYVFSDDWREAHAGP